MSYWLRVPGLLSPMAVPSLADAVAHYQLVTGGTDDPPLGRVSELTKVWAYGERSPRRWYLINPDGRVCRARAGQNQFTPHSEVTLDAHHSA